MRPDVRPHLRRFVARVHRRLVMLRLVEAAGLGMLGGAAVCLLLMPVQIWRGQAAWPVAEILPPVSTGAGLIWALLRLPRASEAAGEADRQLRLADLLTTALSISDKGDDRFAGAVLAQAEAACATLSPGAVLLNRLGARAWGGIGLAGALVLTLGLISANPIESQAVTTRRHASARVNERSDQKQASPAGSAGSGRRVPAIVSDHADDDVQEPPDAGNGTTSARTDGGHGDGSADAADPNGAGRGAGRSNDPARNDPNRTVEGTGGTGSSPTGAAAGGAGVGREPGNTNGAEGTGLSVGRAGNAVNRPAPPWASADWGTSRQTAEGAIRSGQVPTEYHELIRAYFDRQ
jgi:hypothetical protein